MSRDPWFDPIDRPRPLLSPALCALTLALALTLIFTLPAVAAAQTGTVQGRVMEAGSGKPLPSSTVRLVGASSVGVLSDAAGRFVLRGIPAGEQEIEATFLGYEPTTSTISIPEGGTVTADFALTVQAVEVSGITVFGSATRGQAFALQRQKTAPNITNVVSEELFNRFPDRNAAETLRRLPGISVNRDQGEGESVQIRGIDQEYNSLTLNGVRIPAPDEGGGKRSVGLDMINNNLLGEIEVVKALTPAMDADAVGGVVNFGLRSAPAEGVGRVEVGTGLNNQTSDFDSFGNEIFDASSVWGQRFDGDRFGLLLDGAYYRTSRQSKLREFNYDDEDGSIDETIYAQHTNDYDVLRDRFGFSATTDYQFSPGSRAYGTASYNVYLDNEVRREVEYHIEDQEETRETRNRVEDQRVRLFMLGGENDLGPVQLDYRGAWIRATEELPDRTYLRYQRDINYSGFTNDEVKSFDGTTRLTGFPEPTLNRIRRDDMLKDDADLSGQLDLTVPFALADGSSALQFGGKVLRKDVSYERVRFQTSDFTRSETLEEGRFGFEDVRWDDPELQPVITGWGDPFKLDGDYDASETVTALYAMTTLELGPSVTVLTGARWERTSTDFTQPNPETQSEPLTGEGGYDNLMPSAHLTIRPDADSNVRLAYTTGLARPRYEELVPRRVVDEEDRTISYGNPDLEPRTAHSFDVLYERFTSGLGNIGVGTFYKRFNAFHTTRRFEELVDGVPYEARQTVMGDGVAEYFGLEFSFNQPLSLLTATLNDFRLFGNYNYTWSEGEVDGRAIPLTNSPKHTANLSVLYDNPRLGFSFVVASNYRDALLIGVGDADHEDVYFDREFHLDLSLVKTLSDRLSVSTQFNGLTAQREQEVLGNPANGNSRILQWEEYGPYATVSLSYVFR